jgi:hypothetical protein
LERAVSFSEPFLPGGCPELSRRTLNPKYREAFYRTGAAIDLPVNGQFNNEVVEVPSVLPHLAIDGLDEASLRIWPWYIGEEVTRQPGCHAVFDREAFTGGAFNRR